MPDKLSAALAPSIDETKRKKLLYFRVQVSTISPETLIWSEVTKLPSSVNSMKANRRTELGSPHMRQSTTFHGGNKLVTRKNEQ